MERVIADHYFYLSQFVPQWSWTNFHSGRCYLFAKCEFPKDAVGIPSFFHRALQVPSDTDLFAMIAFERRMVGIKLSAGPMMIYYRQWMGQTRRRVAAHC